MWGRVSLCEYPPLVAERTHCDLSLLQDNWPEQASKTVVAEHRKGYRGNDELLNVTVILGVGTMVRLVLLSWRPRTNENKPAAFTSGFFDRAVERLRNRPNTSNVRRAN